MQDYQIIGYQPHLMEQVAVLHAAAFGLDPIDSAGYLTWKYEQNPYITDPLLVLAQNRAGEVVGMRGFYGTRWHLNGSSTCIPCADDFAIAVSERNSGLATLLMQASLDALRSRGFERVLNTSGGTVTVLQQLAMGWKSLGPMEPVVRITGTGRAYRAIANRSMRIPILHRLVDHLRWDASACFARLEQSAESPALRSPCVTVDRTPKVDAMCALAADCLNDRLVSHSRDASYLRWRFLNPSRDYRFIFLERGGRLAGYLVVASYRQFRYRDLPCSIVDLLGRTDGDRTTLIEMAVSWGRFSAIGAWFSAFTSDGQQSLVNAGFIPAELDARARGLPCALLKSLAPGGDPQMSLFGATWDIRQVDTMHG